MIFNIQGATTASDVTDVEYTRHWHLWVNKYELL